MSKFSAQHYNAIAKDICEEFEKYVKADFNHIFENEQDYKKAVDFKLATTGALVRLALRFAHRFKEDNDRFDPLKFLEACSPNNDLYPLSELWEE